MKTFEEFFADIIGIVAIFFRIVWKSLILLLTELQLHMEQL